MSKADAVREANRILTNQFPVGRNREQEDLYESTLICDKCERGKFITMSLSRAKNRIIVRIDVYFCSWP